MFWPISQQFANASAHERVLPLQIQHQNQIGETLQQVPPEFFLPLQLLLKCALLRNIHQRAVIADDLSRLHHAARSIDAHRDPAIFSSQSNLARASSSTLTTRAAQHGLRTRIDAQLFRSQVQQISFAVVTENRYQRRIHLQQLPFGTADVNALLQRLEQLRKALLLLAIPGNIARQNARARDVTTLHDRIYDTIVVTTARLSLKLELDHSRPRSLLQKPR